ncbi:asparagine synthase-related protein [Haloechinothrix sp. LS1_15]|uniref:asparagine synthase-related protein n=1 Tax=Haloechinothrix sp. LS1_15 TaxID=2652248 RepID=UPI00294B9782|nr:asparagine synthase-related protein [Haloechinothrix sp. LS1_15]
MSSGAADGEGVYRIRDTQGRQVGALLGWLSGHPVCPDTRTSQLTFVQVDAATAFIDRAWGAYAALTANAQRLVLQVDHVGFRTFFWMPYQSGIVFGSRLAELVELAGHQPGFDWSYLGDYLLHGNLPTTATGLTGVRRLLPGRRREVTMHERNEYVRWTPLAIAADASGRAPSPQSLRHWVDTCVDTWAGDAERVYVELSGGLDSAVIARSLVASGRRVIGGHFHHPESALADEHTYARSIAHHLGIELHVIDASEALPLTPVESWKDRWDAPTATCAWQSLTAAHQRLAERHGCRVIMAGTGGDHVFVARPGWPWYLDDHLHNAGIRDAFRQVVAVSWRTGIPIVALMTQLARRRLARRRGRSAPMEQLCPEVDRPLWLNREAVDPVVPSLAMQPASGAALPAGKAAQAVELTLLSCAIGVGHSGRRAARTAFPLLSQPLIELGLRTRLDAMIDAYTDRKLLRTAMRDHLPEQAVRRCDKGEHTATWQRGIRANLTSVRELVGDGLLAQQDIIDRRRALDAVSAAALGHTGRLWPLVNLLCAELWLRSWS